MSKVLRKKARISSAEFDRRFERGEDLSQWVDWHSATVVKPVVQRVAVDFPQWMVAAVDVEARRIGLTRQAILKVWVSERLQK